MWVRAGSLALLCAWLTGRRVAALAARMFERVTGSGLISTLAQTAKSALGSESFARLLVSSAECGVRSEE